MYRLLEPKSEAELARYFHFRWSVLRQPFRLPEGSEKDEYDPFAIHRMLVDAQGAPCAVGRLYLVSKEEAQIRYMAVAPERRGLGLGSRVIEALEGIAREQGIERIVLNARIQAVPFYEKMGYQASGESGPTHFGKIHHLQMMKTLSEDSAFGIHAEWCKSLIETWHERIPLSKQMGIRIIRFTGGMLKTRAAFNANLNVQGGLFSGSAFALASLTGWGMLQLQLRARAVSAMVSLKEGSIVNHEPITTEPQGCCHRSEIQGSLEPLSRGKRCS